MHIAVDRKTKRILNIIIIDSSTGDAKEFIPLLEPVENVRVAAPMVQTIPTNIQYLLNKAVN